MKQKIFLLLLLIIAFSCKNKKNNILIINENSTRFNAFPKEEKVQFNNLIEYKSGNPSEIHVLDSTLVIFNSNKGSDYFLYNFSFKTNTISKGFIAKGKGPFESIGASKMGVLKDKIWLYDRSLFKVIFLNKKKFENNELDLNYQEFSLKKNDLKDYFFYGELSFIDSLNFLGIDKWGSSSQFKIEKVNLNSKSKNIGFGSYKTPSNGLNIGTIKNAYRSHIYFNHKKQKAALPYRYTDVLEIFDINSGEYISTQGPENYDVHFTEEKSTYYYMGKTKETKKTFISGTYTDDFIYLIYSGYIRKNRAESDRFKWITGKYVFVYDWDGNPVKKINLDRRVNSIGVSSDNKTLYSYDLKTGYLMKTNINEN